jgi:hypothetical protein
VKGNKFDIKKTVIFNFISSTLGIIALMYTMYVSDQHTTIPTMNIVCAGCIIIFILKRYISKVILYVSVILYALSSAIFIGYFVGYNSNIDGSEKFLFESEGTTYVIVGYYSDYYISSKLDTKSNIFSPEYQLFALDSEDKNGPIIIKKSSDKITFKKKIK